MKRPESMSAKATLVLSDVELNLCVFFIYLYLDFGVQNASHQIMSTN